MPKRPPWYADDPHVTPDDVSASAECLRFCREHPNVTFMVLTLRNEGVPWVRIRDHMHRWVRSGPRPHRREAKL